MQTSVLFSELTLAALEINTLASELADNKSWSWNGLNRIHHTLQFHSSQKKKVKIKSEHFSYNTSENGHF